MSAAAATSMAGEFGVASRQGGAHAWAMLILARLTASLALFLLTGSVARCADPPAHDFSKWEKDIAAFEQADAAHPPPQGALLFIGSSNIRMWKTLAQDLPGHAVINRGFGGSEIADATHFAPRIVYPCKPKAVYLRSGVNDLWNGKSVDQVVEDFKAFDAALAKHLPETDLIFVSINPSIARWKQADATREMNRRIAEHLRDRPRRRYVETYDMVLGPDGLPRPELFVADKLHLSEEGYRLLAERVARDVEGYAKP